MEIYTSLFYGTKSNLSDLGYRVAQQRNANHVKVSWWFILWGQWDTVLQFCPRYLSLKVNKFRASYKLRDLYALKNQYIGCGYSLISKQITSALSQYSVPRTQGLAIRQYQERDLLEIYIHTLNSIISIFHWLVYKIRPTLWDKPQTKKSVKRCERILTNSVLLMLRVYIYFIGSQLCEIIWRR